MMVSSGNGARTNLADDQLDAIEALQKIEARLSQRDAFILREVCGKGEDVSVAVKLVQPSYKFATWPRFCEALDSLCDAMVARHTK
jgi:hypothetical protein